MFAINFGQSQTWMSVITGNGKRDLSLSNTEFFLSLSLSTLRENENML